MPNENSLLARCGRHYHAFGSLAMLATVLFMAAYYGAILTVFRFDFFHPIYHGLTFNSMLEHLLRGEFDVDPGIVRDEGFLRNGRVYAYWGVGCALLRLPLLATGSLLDVDITVLSCLIATCVAGAMKLRALIIIRNAADPTPLADSLFMLLVIFVVFGGPAVGYLVPSIYQEVVSWSAAIGAAFILLAVKGLVRGSFGLSLLAMMAVLAGLSLLVRVSGGMGLYAALGLLLLVESIASRPVDGSDGGRTGDPVKAGGGPEVFRNRRMHGPGRLARNLLSARVLIPGCILAVFVLLTGIVNYGRWGNPTVFADYTHYVTYYIYPDRRRPFQDFGLFNMARIPLAAMYYFIPVWVLSAGDGTFLFQQASQRLFDLIELPPSTFLLTDLLSLAFIALLLRCLWRSDLRHCLAQRVALWPLLALAAGLAVPCVLMLTAINLTYRFRMEFYPLIDLLSLTGFFAVLLMQGRHIVGSATFLWLRVATVVSVVSAHVILFAYALHLFGDGNGHLGAGLLRSYSWETQRALMRWLHHAGLWQ